MHLYLQENFLLPTTLSLLNPITRTLTKTTRREGLQNKGEWTGGKLYHGELRVGEELKSLE